MTSLRPVLRCPHVLSAVRAERGPVAMSLKALRAATEAVEPKRHQHSKWSEQEADKEASATGLAWNSDNPAAHSAGKGKHQNAKNRLIVHSATSCRAPMALVNAGGSA